MALGQFVVTLYVEMKQTYGEGPGYKYVYSSIIF